MNYKFNEINHINYCSVGIIKMKKTTQFERSIIVNFLNAHDKLKVIANVSKEWR